MFARLLGPGPVYPCAMVGIAMMRLRALGVPQPP